MDKKVLEYFNGDELAASVWENKYKAENEETPDDTYERLSKEFARIESNYKDDHWVLSDDFIKHLFKDGYIIPGGSVLANAGLEKPVSLSNCFVVESPEDSYNSIMKIRNYQIQLMKRRGGVGYDLSKLRPNGAMVNNAASTSTGAASFMDVNSALTNEVAMNGRRGALMLTISIDHPDAEEFIEKKQDLTKVTGANISVKVSDAFMRAVKNDEVYYQRYPLDLDFDTIYVPTNSKIGELIEVGYHKYVKRIKARDLWNKLIHCAWNTAEPGIIFDDAMHLKAPDRYYPEFSMISTNPCGEIGMGAMDSCRLIHINLAKCVKYPYTEKAELDYDVIAHLGYYAMKLGDDLVDLEQEAVKRIIDVCESESEEQKMWEKILDVSRRGRRAGVGILGLADMLAQLNVKYGSPESIPIIKAVMETIFRAELKASVDMAESRGVFEEYDGFDKENPLFQSLVKQYDPEIYRKMLKVGRRNISFSTIAPTGSVAMLTQTSSGIEPVFMPYYKRRKKCTSDTDRVDYVDKLGIKFTEYMVVHEGLKRWAKVKYPEENINEWDLDKWDAIYKESPYYGATAHDIDWHYRIMTQAACQTFITHSISSTINLPTETTEEEIAEIYKEAWENGLKGVTVYRDGCREGILNSVSDKQKEERFESSISAPKRPKKLDAEFYSVKVGGEIFYVMIGLYKNKPYEAFCFKPEKQIKINNHKGILTKKAKGLYSFHSDLINIDDLDSLLNAEQRTCTLLVSALLRHGIPLKFIIKTEKKVNENITSFSSAICRILSKYMPKEESAETCPKCGGRLIREGGCIRCLDCDYSKCL